MNIILFYFLAALSHDFDQQVFSSTDNNSRNVVLDMRQ
jgi:hypothetical protein